MSSAVVTSGASASTLWAVARYSTAAGMPLTQSGLRRTSRVTSFTRASEFLNLQHMATSQMYIFNKIATHRINSRWHMDKEALWLIESPTYLSKCTLPFLGICQFRFLNILTLLAPIQSANNMFHSFTVLCEKENDLISNLHCFFANVTPCPLVLLSSLTDKKICLSIFSYPFNILKTYIWSPRSFLVYSVVNPHSFRRIS